MRDWYVWVIVGFVAAVWGYWLGARHQRELAVIDLDTAINRQKKISLEEGRARGYEEGFADCKSAVESMIWDEAFDPVYREILTLYPRTPEEVREARMDAFFDPDPRHDYARQGKALEEAREIALGALADWQSKFARVVAKRREEGLLTDNQRRES